jgi:hypothetical protein
MIMELLESPLFEQFDTSSLFNIGAGGGDAPEDRPADAGGSTIPCPGTGWGMTETNALGSSFAGNAFHEHMGSSASCSPDRSQLP